MTDRSGCLTQLHPTGLSLVEHLIPYPLVSPEASWKGWSPLLGIFVILWSYWVYMRFLCNM